MERPVIIIDDDPNDVVLATDLLVRAGIANPVTHLADGAAAIAYFENCLALDHELPVLILLDLKMPGVDGFEVLEWMSQRPALAPVQTVILTSSDDKKDVARANKLGVKTFLKKYPRMDQIKTIFQLASAMRPMAEVVRVEPRLLSSRSENSSRSTRSPFI